MQDSLDRTLVNVCGAGRSGTTMLDLMLGNASNAFSCGEVYAWFRPWRTTHFNPICPCGENPCLVWKKIKDCEESSFHLNVFEQLNVDFVVDSSKQLYWIIDSYEWAKTNDISVYNILIWKDPVNLSYSHWKRGEGLWYWREEFSRYYGKVIELGLPVIAIKLEDLVANPSEKLSEICEAIGMPYFEGKERFWEKQHHHFFGSKGTRDQVSSGHSDIVSASGFPSEFEALLPQLVEAIDSDQEINRIVSFLKANDITNNLGHQSPHNYSTKKARGSYWYCMSAIKRRIRRYFPQQVL